MIQEPIKPFLGETVIYVQPGHEQPINGTREHPAIVTRVWNETMVNLKVMFDCGPTESVGSVMRDDVASQLTGHWYRSITILGTLVESGE